MKKQALSVFLILAMLMSACGTAGSSNNSDDISSDTSSSVPTTTADPLADGVETEDFGGRTFTILSRKNFTYEFDCEQTGDLLDDALYERNRIVEERFNVDIIVKDYDGTAGSTGNLANVLELADPSILAGDDEFQLLSGYLYRAAPGSVNGNYMNWYDMPHIGLDKPWWEDDFLEEIAINGKAYVALGDLSILFNEVKMAIFFNKQLAEDLKIPNLYSSVKDGSWTLDKLAEYAQTAKADLNGDGKMDTNDRFGIGANKYTHTVPLIYSCGTKATARDDDGLPSIINESQRFFDVFDKIYKLFNESGAGYLSGELYGFAEEMFEGGQGLFMTSWIGSAKDLRSMITDFGILPYPKWDAAQETYYTSYLDRTSGFLVPITADTDFVGKITEVMAAESYKQVVPVFYEKALSDKYARDTDSIEMLDIITRNTVYDFGLIFSYLNLKSNPIMLFREGIYNQEEAFASKLASVKDAYAASIKKLAED